MAEVILNTADRLQVSVFLLNELHDEKYLRVDVSGQGSRLLTGHCARDPVLERCTF